MGRAITTTRTGPRPGTTPEPFDAAAEIKDVAFWRRVRVEP
jgi:hypothetical protein